MPEIFTLIVALLAAVGTMALVWLLVRAVMKSDGAGTPVYAVVRLSGPSTDVQGTVRRLNWLCQWGAADLRVILADDGMTAEARKEAEILLRAYPAVTLCTMEHVTEIISRV